MTASSWVPVPVSWHCPRCAVQWASRTADPCFVCGGAATRGVYVNAAGVTSPVTNPMTVHAGEQQAGMVLL